MPARIAMTALQVARSSQQMPILALLYFPAIFSLAKAKAAAVPPTRAKIANGNSGATTVVNLTESTVFEVLAVSVPFALTSPLILVISIVIGPV